jgi:hypothetical protein
VGALHLAVIILSTLIAFPDDHVLHHLVRDDTVDSASVGNFAIILFLAQRLGLRRSRQLSHINYSARDVARAYWLSALTRHYSVYLFAADHVFRALVCKH